MNLETLRKANDLNNDMLGVKNRSESTLEAIKNIQEVVTKDPRLICPLVCPLTGTHMLVTSLELLEMYKKSHSRLLERLSDLEFEFNEL